MQQIFIQPPPPLDRYVAALLYWESPARMHSLERIMPTGTTSLIINLLEDEVRDYAASGQLTRYGGTVVVGARSQYSIIDTQEQIAVMGVEFRPGGAWPLFGLAADELSHQHVGLADLWGAAGRSLRDRILCAPTATARLQILGAALTANLSERTQQHPAVEFALRQLHGAAELATIEDLSRGAGISSRRLARLFSIEVGLTPKLYARVLRFGRVLQAAHGNTHVDWQDIAFRCGYFDQAHFIRDFKAFCGLTPGEYLVRRTPFAHHVLL